ncbi:MAG: nucleotidyl transferase AbiEii/AbiGii toxin family protein [Bacteroidetes bacterium]|nr:nucleotidyl transferase AbiEii/AbiGii toxin family protein [Bacteroidota bacterium]
MKIPALKDFSLVGGTAFSLLYRHRKSVDLDLFSNKPFTNESIISSLQKNSATNLLKNKSLLLLAFLDLLMMQKQILSVTLIH